MMLERRARAFLRSGGQSDSTHPAQGTCAGLRCLTILVIMVLEGIFRPTIACPGGSARPPGRGLGSSRRHAGLSGGRRALDNVRTVGVVGAPRGASNGRTTPGCDLCHDGATAGHAVASVALLGPCRGRRLASRSRRAVGVDGSGRGPVDLERSGASARCVPSSNRVTLQARAMHRAVAQIAHRRAGAILCEQMERWSCRVRRCRERAGFALRGSNGLLDIGTTGVDGGRV